VRLPGEASSSRLLADRIRASEVRDASANLAGSITNERCTENQTRKTKKHKLAYDVVSEKHRCEKCGKPIKQRLVNAKTTPPRLCFRHYLESKGKTKSKRRRE